MRKRFEEPEEYSTVDRSFPVVNLCEALAAANTDMMRQLEDYPIKWWRPHQVRQITERGIELTVHWVFGFRLWRRVRVL